jgi:hypothetical protein
MELLNMIFMIYQGINMPLECRFDNRLELANQFILGLSSFYMNLFTDFVPSQESKYEFAKHMLFFVFVLCSINILIILYFSGHSFYLLGKKHWYLNCYVPPPKEISVEEPIVTEVLNVIEPIQRPPFNPYKKFNYRKHKKEYVSPYS